MSKTLDSIIWKQKCCREEVNSDSMLEIVYLTCFPLLLLFGSQFASEDPAPLPDCKLKCLSSAHREIICPCPSVNKEINMPFPNAAHSLGDVLQD